METKANHLAVGAFVLVTIVGLFAFALWLGKVEIDREFDRYYIYFTGSVSGLTTASAVRYRGVPVGMIADIRIDPGNSERVRVTIEVTRGTPIKEDAIATLELQGITGLVDVEIKGGSRDSPPLEAKGGDKFAVIASTPSTLETLFEDMPRAVNRFTHLIERAALLLSDENIAAINDTLGNLKTLTDTLAASSDDIKTLTSDATATFGEVRRTAEEIGVLVEDLRDRLPTLVDNATSTLSTVKGSTETLTGEAQATLREIRQSAQTLNGAAGELDKMLAENRPAFRDFSRDGLYALSRFLFGDSEAGFEPQ